MGHVPERRFLSLPDELERLALNGRATDSQFAQNPLPIAQAMGRALAMLHQQPVPYALTSRTESEMQGVRDAVASGGPFPSPYTRVSSQAILASLDAPPEASDPVVTHGSPIVDSVVLVDSVATFESAGTDGFDPPERDLAIVIRSLAETFSSEVARTFIEGYEEAGGKLPKAQAIDWYGLLAAFR